MMEASLNRAMTVSASILGTWPAFVILILLSSVIFGFLVPRAKAPIFHGAAATLPRKVLDEYFPTWTPQIAETFLEAIGPEGRAAYRRFYLTMDFWFPGAVASLAIASLLLIAFPPSSGWAWLGVLAAPSWVFDLAENVTHFMMAGGYPKRSSAAMSLGPLFTGAKWVCALVPLPIALMGLAFQFLQGPY
jgi:hypothetical protein